MAQNLTPQQIQQIQVQATTQSLQAPLQYGTEKLLINVNGQNSKLPTNKNGIIKYTLEQPVKLNIGDRVTLIESFVEERGLSIDTISIEEDIEEEIRFLYYSQGDLRNTINVPGSSPFTAYAPDQEFQCFPSLYPDCFNSKYGVLPEYPDDFQGFLGGLGKSEPYLYPSRNYLYNTQEATVDGVGEGFNATTGANGQYYYMCELFNPRPETTDITNPKLWNQNEFTLENGQKPQSCWFRPIYGQATIKIPAGNYSVSALSDLINNQLNGTSTPNKLNVDKMKNKLYSENPLPANENAMNTLPYFNGLNQKTNIKNEIPISEYNPDSLIIGEDLHQPYDRRRGDMIVEMKFNNRITANRINMTTLRFNENVANPPYADPTTLPKFENGLPVAVNQGEEPPVIGEINCGFLSASSNEDRILEGEDDRVIMRRFGTNFYLHLDAFQNIFGGLPDGDQGKGSYYDLDYSIGGNDMNQGKWNPKYMPTLAEIFSQNLGSKGMFFYDQNIVEYNTIYDGDSQTGSKPYYSTNPLSTRGAEGHKFQCLFPVLSSGSGSNPITDVPNNFGEISQFGGTTSFELKYDTASANRFSILNLHEPYKMASRTPDNKSDTNVGGQQATIFNTPILIDGENQQITTFKNNYCGIYPIDSAGGIAVNNFSFSTVKNTKIYKDLVTEINALNTSNAHYQMAREKAIYELFTKPYDEFFDSQSSAEEAWSKTLWNRLGFTYEQLGNVSNNLETIFTFSTTTAPRDIDPISYPVNPRFIKQKGIITHNAFDYTFIPSSSGLGNGNPLSSSSASENPQNYGLRGYTSGGVYSQLPSGITLGVLGNYINILANSSPINALNFPSLNNGNNYLVIESDIVKPNAKDSNSNSTTIVGIMSKQNASNDTIYSVSPVSFIVTEPKLLSTIEVQIKNPDGTLVSDNVVGKNNGFVFQLEKAIEVANIAGQSF